MANDQAAAVNRPWTAAQRSGIEAAGCNVLVSAAAGSGKTSVLAERCAYFVCDAEPRCGVDELLVVTFTEAAAAEMKSRIAAALRHRHEARPDDAHITRQLALLDSAAIGTLHGFCARLLRHHFHLLGLDPEFTILDADEAKLLRQEVARDLLEEWFDRDDSQAFSSFVNLYGDGDDGRIETLLLRTYEMLTSVADASGWIGQSLDTLREAAERPLAESKLGRAYLAAVATDLESIRSNCVAAGKWLDRQSGFEGYVQWLRETYKSVHHWEKILASHGLSALMEVAGEVDLPALPRVGSKVPGKDSAAARVREVRDQIESGSWRRCLQFGESQLQEGVARTLPHAQTLLDLVQAFQVRYAEAKTRAATLDFSDLERFALRILGGENPTARTASAVARSYQRQFAHVLVDEFQDINELQHAILCLVSRCDQGSQANLFCVGDVKQSIYQFRLAEPALFLSVLEQYRRGDSHERTEGCASFAGGQVIDLQQNFRSRAPLLTAINNVFERLMTQAAVELDYDHTQALHPGAQFPPAGVAGAFEGAPIELHVIAKNADASGVESGDMPADDLSAAPLEELDRTRREATLAARRILELVGQGGEPARMVVDGAGLSAGFRPVRFGDVVILLRSMKYKADEFVDVLRSAGIPAHSQSSTGYFEATEVNDVLSLLAVLDNAQQDIPLAAVLRSPLVALPDAETALARIRLAHPEGAFHEAVAAFAERPGDELAEKLRQTFRTLDRWRTLVRRRPLAEALWSIYDQSGYLAFCGGLPDGEQRTANLLELYERASQFDTFRRQGLSRFLAFLEKLKSDSDLGQASIASPAEDVVRVMSIHRAKGLEFPVVILPDLGKKLNFDSAQGVVLAERRTGLGLQVIDPDRQVRYPSLAWSVVQRRLRQQTSAEELRVLYVAMTRAKEHLILIGTTGLNQTEKWASRWGDHTGPIPADVVLAGKTALDWVGPAAVANGEGGAAWATLAVQSPEALEAWHAQRVSTTRLPRPQQSVVNLLPLDPPPASSTVADEIIERVGRTYRFEKLARLPATTSVTALSHRGVDPRPVEKPNAALPLDHRLRPLNLPGDLASPAVVAPASATDRGNATHTLLQHLDFAQAADRAAIERQLRAFVEHRRLSEAEAALVDVDAVRWMLEQAIGRQLVQHAGKLMREVPIYFAEDTGEKVQDKLDLRMVRGRLDLLLPVDGEWVIVDYKTDRVSGELLERRAAEYSGQLILYRKAIERITKQIVRQTVIVFLDARVVVEV